MKKILNPFFLFSLAVIFIGSCNKDDDAIPVINNGEKTEQQKVF